MESSKLIDNYLKDRISKVPTKKDDLEAFKHFTELQKGILIDGLLNKKQNLEKYLEYAEIVKDEQFFRIEHIHRLGLPYDVLLYKSEKNIGKSYYMIQACNKIIKDGGQVAIIRVQESDIKCGLKEHLDSYGAIFDLDGQGRLWTRQNEDQDPDEAKEKKRRAGIAMSVSSGVKWKGGGYENIKKLFFDEFSDLRDDVKYPHYKNFFTAILNSIERRKTGMQLECFGNSDITSNHPLFQVFQIDPDENLVYVERQNPGSLVTTKILYINSRGLFKEGAKTSKFINAIGDPHAAMCAYMNSARDNVDKVISLDLTAITTPYMCIAFRINTDEYHLKISTYHYQVPAEQHFEGFDIDEHWYYLKVDAFSPVYLYGYQIATSDPLLYSKHRNIMYFKKDLYHQWAAVKRIIKSGKCFFIGNETVEIIGKVLEKNTKNDLLMWET